MTITFTIPQTLSNVFFPTPTSSRHSPTFQSPSQSWHSLHVYNICSLGVRSHIMFILYLRWKYWFFMKNLIKTTTTTIIAKLSKLKIISSIIFWLKSSTFFFLIGLEWREILKYLCNFDLLANLLFLTKNTHFSLNINKDAAYLVKFQDHNYQ